MTDTRHYDHCGLTVSSALALPELGPGSARRDATDVQISLATPVGGPVAAVGDDYRFTVREAGEYRVRDGREISVTPAADADPATTRLFLLGSAWGALLTQRGAFAFHAGVVATRAGTVAFCGPPGAGKSTLVAAHLADGGGLVSDDLTRLEMVDTGPPLVWPSAPQLRLTADSLDHLRLSTHTTEGSPLDGKRRVSWLGARVAQPQRLTAICVLAWAEADLRRLRGASAAQRLMTAATYRPGFFDTTPAMVAHWRQCVEITRRVPIIELSRPRDWDRFATPDIDAIIAAAV